MSDVEATEAPKAKSKETVFRRFLAILRDLRDEVQSAFLSRKYWIFIFCCSAACFHLWRNALTPEKPRFPEAEFVQLIIWLFLIFFVGTTAQKVIDREKQQRAVSHRITSPKFLSTSIILVFINFALATAVLTSGAYTTLTIWLVGLFIGVDIADIMAYRKLGMDISSDALKRIVDGQQDGHIEKTVTQTTKTTVTAATSVEPPTQNTGDDSNRQQ